MHSFSLGVYSDLGRITVAECALLPALHFSRIQIKQLFFFSKKDLLGCHIYFFMFVY